jgi:hypothetical protein
MIKEQKMLQKSKQWWEKPGFGIMYQIEARPGWLWNRNFDKFNASMTDDKGNLRFNGPFCKMKEWVEFSKKVGVDYHIFEAKWHDGICYFNTKHTNWKTPTDYCKIYSEESKKAKIPFMFYYSSVFDHSPQFNDIQPLRSGLMSYIAKHSISKSVIAIFSLAFTIGSWVLRYAPNRYVKRIPQQEKDAKYFDNLHLNKFVYNPRKYEKYMLKQLIELIEVYKCDGLWMDWYQMHMEASSDIIMDFMEKKYPKIVLTFNNSIRWTLKWAHYLSTEAHGIKKAWVKANKFRKTKKPWELISPAANYWDNPMPKADPLEDTRMAVVVMACGGKSAFGMPSLMNGELYSGPSRHLDLLGKWYIPRRSLFTEAIPMKYRGKKVPSVKVNQKNFGTIGTVYNDDKLIHIINFSGRIDALTILLNQKKWGNVKKAILEPNGKEIPITTAKDGFFLSIPKEDVDKIDTILRICEK